MRAMRWAATRAPQEPPALQRWSCGGLGRGWAGPLARPAIR